MNKSDTKEKLTNFSKGKSWSAVYHDLLQKDKENPLEADNLYTLALASYFVGKDQECVDLLARLHHEYLEHKNVKRAVFCGFWIGMLLMSKGERARSSGWFARAGRLIEDCEEDCVEKGLLLIPVALQVMYGGDPQKAYKIFQQAAQTGENFNDADLKTFSSLGSGQSLIMQEKIQEGVAMLDEAMVSVESDDVSPIVVGIVYCAVIEACQKIFDLRRAQEWTTALSRWCSSQPDMVPFRGQCLIRRSQIMQYHGEWPEALDEMQRACDVLTRPPGEPAAGEAYYQLAELYRLMGEYNQAEKCYMEANKYGKKPQPGFSRLRLAQMQTDAARLSIQNALDEAKNPYYRISILPVYIEIMLTCGNHEVVQIAVDELSAIAEKFNTPYIYALSAYSRGTLHLSQGDAASALRELGEANQLWKELDIPYEAARSRLQRGLAYRQAGDEDSATLEIAAAQWTFKELNAMPDLNRANKLLKQNKSDNLFGLSKRELDVLRLVAAGDTNKSIASQLYISERTVERHLSNIFNKLDVKSRTAAGNFAHQHKLF
jgi:DNA-binding CsgD family transcriptional regulator